MGKKLLWMTGEKNPYTGRYEGALIDANQTYNAVYVGEQGARIWVKVAGDTRVEIPNLITWEDEEYNSLRDMDSDDLKTYLDSLVGQEGEEISDYEKQDNCLAFDYYNNEFANLTNWETYKCYDYFENTNPKTIVLDTDNEYGYYTEYELDIVDTYNLDYIDYVRNNTNFEYGGLGNHALLHKVIIDGATKGLLWHEWSQWQGSELDMGSFITKEEALEQLENHPEIEEIEKWLKEEFKMIKIKRENFEWMKTIMDYELENGAILHKSEWNGEVYIVKTSKGFEIYKPVQVKNDDDTWTTIGFEECY